MVITHPKFLVKFQKCNRFKTTIPEQQYNASRPLSFKIQYALVWKAWKKTFYIMYKTAQVKNVTKVKTAGWSMELESQSPDWFLTSAYKSAARLAWPPCSATLSGEAWRYHYWIGMQYSAVRQSIQWRSNYAVVCAGEWRLQASNITLIMSHTSTRSHC